MSNIIGTINNTISISLFNKETINQIFEDVKITGSKIVMNDDVAECVLISPNEYARLIEEVSDARLLKLANNRLKDYDPKKNISGEDVFRNLGISDDDLNDYHKVEFE